MQYKELIMNIKTLVAAFLLGTTALAETTIEFSYPSDISEGDVTCSELNTTETSILCDKNIESGSASCSTQIVFKGTKVSQKAYGHLYNLTSRSNDNDKDADKNAYLASKALQSELSKLYSGSDFKHPKCAGYNQNINGLSAVSVTLRNKNSTEVNYNLRQSINRAKTTSDQLCLSEISETSCYSGARKESEGHSVYTRCSNDFIYKNKNGRIFSESLVSSYSASATGAAVLTSELLFLGVPRILFNSSAKVITYEVSSRLQKKLIESQNYRFELENVERCDGYSDLSNTITSRDNVPLK